MRRANTWSREAGGEFSKEDLTYLRAELTGTTLQDVENRKLDEAIPLFAELYEVMQRVVAYSRESGAVVRDGRANLMQRMSTEFGDDFDRLRTIIESEREHGICSQLDVPERPDVSRMRRQVLVIQWDRSGHWWWIDRAPSRTELAVLSILAGNFPDRRGAFKRGNFDPTTASVIEAEACCIDLARKALRPRRRP